MAIFRIKKQLYQTSIFCRIDEYAIATVSRSKPGDPKSKCNNKCIVKNSLL